MDSQATEEVTVLPEQTQRSILKGRRLLEGKLLPTFILLQSREERRRLKQRRGCKRQRCGQERLTRRAFTLLECP